MTKTSAILSAMTLTSILGGGTAYGESFGTPTTQTANITFTEPAKALALELKVTPDLIAGPIVTGEIVATATAVSGEGKRIGLRFTPGLENQDVFDVVAFLRGQNNHNHQIELYIESHDSHLVTIGGESYFVKNDVGDYEEHFKLSRGANNGIVDADIYQLSIDAVNYTP